MSKHQQRATDVVELVMDIRNLMPRIGTRKLYYLLEGQLRELGVGRDKLFSILKANHLSKKPKRSYRITTNSHHPFRKHKNLVAQNAINETGTGVGIGYHLYWQ
jgi:hypothetical protein